MPSWTLQSQKIVTNYCMKHEKPQTAPLFAVGDLVKIRGFGILLAKSDFEMGIVYNGPYSWKSVESYHDLVYFEWWCYDVLIGGELITLMPENFLVKIETGISSSVEGE